MSADVPTEPGAYVLVVEEESSWAAPLQCDRTLTIGSAECAGLRLSAASARGEHARLTVRDEVTIHDIQAPISVNGVIVHEKRRLFSGDVVTIGQATLVLHLPRPHARNRRMLGEAEVRLRLVEETERALRYGRPFAVCVVNVTPVVTEDVLACVIASVRAVDVVGRDGDDIVIVMPETTDSARIPAERALSAMKDLARSARAGLALFPSAGCTADALLTAARRASRAAEAGAVFAAADIARTLSIGGRTVVAADPKMHELFMLIRRLAASELPVLVMGETGTGKEVVSEAIHAWSARSKLRFVAINCAAMSETLLESELFGHERGAFSGASSSRAGLFESADGGTVFLDEVGECTPHAQAKLLRVIETKRVCRLGSTMERAVDVRIVAATNRHLPTEVAQGRFREDLLFRLSAATVVVPPLRDRPSDLALLVTTLLADACGKLGRPTLSLGPSAWQCLAGYRWPGNVRELRNVMDYLAATFPGEVVEIADLPEPLRGPSTFVRSSGPFRKLADEVRELEQERIKQALDASDGVRVRAAALLGVPLRTFATKLKEYGLVDRGMR
jgi:DNA-binding NtrC family response regulator